VSQSEVPLRVLMAMDRLGYEGRFHGAGRLVVDWSRALRQRGVDVTTVVLRPEDEFDIHADVPMTYFGRGRYDLRTLRDFRRLLRERDIHVAHLQGFGSLTFGRLAATGTRIPVIAHVHADHNAETGGYPWFVQLADRVLAPHTARCLAVSEATARFATSKQGFRDSQVEVWLNPVDLSDYRPPSALERYDVRRELGLEADALVVVAVARLDHVKGVDLLVSAWPTVARRVSSARLLLVGAGPQRDELVASLEAAGHLNSVHFLGYREDVTHVLHAADVLALPSRSEGMPLAALEGLASGLPVVAHAVGGVPELVVDDENGLLVPPRPEELARALIEVLEDDARRARLARRARPSVEPLDLPVYAARLEKLYRSLIDGEGRPAEAPGRSSTVARTGAVAGGP